MRSSRQVKRRIRIGFLLVMGLMMWLLLPFAVRSLTQRAFFEFVAPLEITASGVKFLQDFWAYQVKGEEDLFEAGRDLARLNAAYELRLQEAAVLEESLERVESLLKLSPPPDYRLVIARVARRDVNSWWQRLIIHKGKDAGIQAGDPVVFAGGIVGKVAEVGLHTATVNLVSSPSLRLAVTLEGDDRPFLYQGQYLMPFSNPVGNVFNLPTDIPSFSPRPRRLMTSGLGGVFPAGITVGHVQKLQPARDGLFQSGVVELDRRLLSLREVAVLIPVDTERRIHGGGEP